MRIIKNVYETDQARAIGVNGNGNSHFFEERIFQLSFEYFVSVKDTSAIKKEISKEMALWDQLLLYIIKRCPPIFCKIQNLC